MLFREINAGAVSLRVPVCGMNVGAVSLRFREINVGAVSLCFREINVGAVSLCVLFREINVGAESLLFKKSQKSEKGAFFMESHKLNYFEIIISVEVGMVHSQYIPLLKVKAPPPPSVRQ